MKYMNYIIAFLIGVVLASLVLGYVGYQQMEKIKADYQPVYSESVQWIIDNPKYADIVKSNHDNYINAAENAFVEGLKVEEGNE